MFCLFGVSLFYHFLRWSLHSDIIVCGCAGKRAIWSVKFTHLYLFNRMWLKSDIKRINNVSNKYKTKSSRTKDRKKSIKIAINKGHINNKTLAITCTLYATHPEETKRKTDKKQIGVNLFISIKHWTAKQNNKKSRSLVCSICLIRFQMFTATNLFTNDWCIQ